MTPTSQLARGAGSRSGTADGSFLGNWSRKRRFAEHCRGDGTRTRGFLRDSAVGTANTVSSFILHLDLVRQEIHFIQPDVIRLPLIVAVHLKSNIDFLLVPVRLRRIVRVDGG